jgi:copper chaperone
MNGDSTQVSAATTVFHVPDMTCNHCVGTIKSALAEQMPGAPVAIDLGKAEVRVGGDKAQAESIIRDAGYTPSVVG